MTKIVQLVNSCRECPNRHYYSGGAYECMKVQPSRLNADMSIPPWCPLPDYGSAAGGNPQTVAGRFGPFTVTAGGQTPAREA